MKFNRILITVINPTFNLTDRYSAVASVIYSFADLLRDDGHEVFVNQWRIEEWEKKSTVNTRAFASGVTKSKWHRLFPPRIREFVKDILLFRSNRKVKQLLFTLPRPDLIISWITYGNSSGVDLAKKWKTPLIAVSDNPISEEYTYLKGFPPFLKWWIDRQEKRIVVNSKAIIIYSEAVKEHLQKVYGTKAKFYFNAFTDFMRMPYLNEEKDISVINFVYIGSFFNWHKVDELIWAFNSLNDKYKNSRLYLVGDGPEYGRIKKEVTNPAIILTGRMDGEPLTELMKTLHVGIISNALWFQAPVKLFQYSASGLAVISKSTPTINELTQEKTCYAFFENKEQLEIQMEKIMMDPGLIKTMSAGSQNHIKTNFSKKNYTEFFNEIFSNL